MDQDELLFALSERRVVFPQKEVENPYEYLGTGNRIATWLLYVSKAHSPFHRGGAPLRFLIAFPVLAVKPRGGRGRHRLPQSGRFRRAH